jgi:hypothetical protein
MSKNWFKLALVVSAMAFALPGTAQAQWWQHHPRYLHAMSDLRSAYWLVAHHESTDPVARPEERRAMDEIARAYQHLKDASIVDNKDIHDQPPADMNFFDHRGRMHRALDLLHEARRDVAGEEDDPAARGFRAGALRDIDKASHALDVAIRAWMF